MPEPEGPPIGEVSDEAIEVLERFSKIVARKWRRPNVLDELVDFELARIEGSLYSLGERSRREFVGVPDLIRQDVGHLPLFEAATLTHAAVHLSSSAWASGVPVHAQYLFAGLTTRAISTVREIAILLDHGYALGAKSRWRTLSEILVVARVVALGDRFTATRYKEHRWIVLEMERRKTGQFEWVEGSPSPEIMKVRLTRRFGPEFAGLYGWAARVSNRRLGVANPGWRHLQEIAGVGEHASRVHEAHHAVHGADALGLLGTVDVHSGHFHAGASHQEVLSVARDTVRLFRQTVSATFGMCTKFADERGPRILESITASHLLNLELGLSMRIVATDAQARASYFSSLSAVEDDAAARR